MIGLLVIFAAIYAFTRNSQPQANPQGSTLATDPNSQPVEAASPAYWSNRIRHSFWAAPRNQKCKIER